jgi:hypothetical protein
VVNMTGGTQNQIRSHTGNIRSSDRSCESGASQ